ncbi:probable E3 ubiquitin-protein ligase RNF144A-A isoform X1 [Thunnus thynnus]|uniref:probable E3 ubiquitin-protein ligase RNF144A-A isoform X1 n=1 Tax=Thunnus thynnus TaxID=8237 RepID=UPI003527535E
MGSGQTKNKPDATNLKSDLTSEEKKTKKETEKETEKCYDPEDSTLRFVDREDEMDFLYIGYESLRALMSCGHAVTPMSLTDWCRHLLDQGESRFVCGQTRCNVEWSFEEVCEMALLTPEEMDDFEKKMISNSKEYFYVKSCPGCKSRVMRADLNDLSVLCSVCTADKKKVYRFCCQCSREWKGPFPRSDRCENDGCINLQVETLRKCPEIIFEDVKDVTGCPSIRACPTCGQLLEHDKTQCKNIVCPRCKVEFCFVCLKVTDECLESSEHYEPCSSGVAPRQTSIPVWKRII